MWKGRPSAPGSIRAVIDSTILKSVVMHKKMNLHEFIDAFTRDWVNTGLGKPSVSQTLTDQWHTVNIPKTDLSKHVLVVPFLLNSD